MKQQVALILPVSLSFHPGASVQSYSPQPPLLKPSSSQLSALSSLQSSILFPQSWLLSQGLPLIPVSKLLLPSFHLISSVSGCIQVSM